VLDVMAASFARGCPERKRACRAVFLVSPNRVSVPWVPAFGVSRSLTPGLERFRLCAGKLVKLLCEDRQSASVAASSTVAVFRCVAAVPLSVIS
jgi:hypothetical protein